MSIAFGHEPDASRTHSEARQRRLRHVLLSRGVLTGEHLRDAAGAEAWRSVPFELALKRAIASGRVVRLADDLYEAGPEI